MTKVFCDYCGSELERSRLVKVNLADAYSVMRLPWSEGQRTYCDLCPDCRDNLHEELMDVLMKYSKER